MIHCDCNDFYANLTTNEKWWNTKRRRDIVHIAVKPCADFLLSSLSPPRHLLCVDFPSSFIIPRFGHKIFGFVIICSIRCLQMFSLCCYHNGIDWIYLMINIHTMIYTFIPFIRINHYVQVFASTFTGFDRIASSLCATFFFLSLQISWSTKKSSSTSTVEMEQNKKYTSGNVSQPLIESDIFVKMQPNQTKWGHNKVFASACEKWL